MTAKELIARLQERFNGRVRDVVEKGPRRVYAVIDPRDIREAVTFLYKELGLRFNIASAVDLLDRFEILYHFTDDRAGIIISIRVFLSDKARPRIDSITPLMRGAEWIEREMHELFGIEFDGHPNMKRLLLPDDWPDGVYPLRKDFVVKKRDDR